MDINTATNYNYTCLSDAGCKPIWEDTRCPSFFIRHIFHKAHSNFGTELVTTMQASREAATTRQRPSSISLGETVVSWYSKPVFTKTVKVNWKKKKKPKRKPRHQIQIGPRPQGFSSQNTDRWCIHCVYSTFPQGNIFQGPSFKWIWINSIIQPNPEDALLVRFNSKCSLEFNSNSF